MDTYMYVMMKVACKNTTECYTEDPTMNEYQNMYGLNVCASLPSWVLQHSFPRT